MVSEITVEVLCSKKTLFAALAAKGFFFKEKLHFIDYYYTTLDLSKPFVEYQKLITKTVLIRNVQLERRYFSSEGVTTLLYKKKQIDPKDRVISEEKLSLNLDSIGTAKRIFANLGMKLWCTKKMTGYIYKKGDMEFLIQDVEGVGIFIEVEQFENQKGTGNRVLNSLIKFVQDLELPLGDDYHVNIAYKMYLNTQNKKIAAAKRAAAKNANKKPKLVFKTKNKVPKK